MDGYGDGLELLSRNPETIRHSIELEEISKFFTMFPLIFVSSTYSYYFLTLQEAFPCCIVLHEAKREMIKV